MSIGHNKCKFQQDRSPCKSYPRIFQSATTFNAFHSGFSWLCLPSARRCLPLPCPWLFTVCQANNPSVTSRALTKSRKSSRIGDMGGPIPIPEYGCPQCTQDGLAPCCFASVVGLGIPSEQISALYLWTQAIVNYTITL